MSIVPNLCRNLYYLVTEAIAWAIISLHFFIQRRIILYGSTIFDTWIMRVIHMSYKVLRFIIFLSTRPWATNWANNHKSVIWIFSVFGAFHIIKMKSYLFLSFFIKKYFYLLAFSLLKYILMSGTMKLTKILKFSLKKITLKF